jgi:DNA-binding beta-propeller fold protein YncE
MKKMLIFLLSSALLSTLIYAQQQNWKGKSEVKNGIVYVHNPEQGLWDHDATKKLTIEKIFSIGSLNANDDYLFSWVKDITTDSAGNIYACDSKEHRIQVYDKTGKYIRTVGRKGQGPGDLMRPKAVRINKDGRIFIQDALNHRISIFKSNGKFYDSFRYKGVTGEYLEINSQGHVIIYPFPTSEKYQDSLPIITVYDLKGNIVNKFGERLMLLEHGPFGKPWYSFNSFTKSTDGSLIVDFNYPYLIHFYQDGKLTKVITRECPIFTVPEIITADFKTIDGKIDKIKTVSQRSTIWRSFVLPNGRFITTIGDAGKDHKTAKDKSNLNYYFDLFDETGYFLKSYVWDLKKNGMITHIDRHGYFYSNRGDSEIVPGVTKWKVTFE